MKELDSLEFVTRLDPKGMYGLTVGFADQCRKALQIARSAHIPAWPKPSNVVLAGLGGSAAGGDFVRCLFEAESDVPFAVARDYVLPGYVGKDTVVICSSYSGNTEETLSAFEIALKKGARILCLTSGGKLAERARELGLPLILIPAGQPPRTALGYMFVPVVWACMQLSLLPRQDFDAAFALLDRSVQSWVVETSVEDNPAKKLAVRYHGAVPILYGLGAWQAAVAYRWKGQIGENAKVLAFTHAFPELNHNEILAWVKANEQNVQRWVVTVLEDGTESAKMRRRAEVTLDLIQHQAESHRAQAAGDTLLQKMLSLVLLGDFVSLYMAAMNGVDPENIDWINTLKAELSQIP